MAPGIWFKEQERQVVDYVIMSNPQTIGDLIREMEERDGMYEMEKGNFTMSSGIACRFVNKLPVNVRDNYYSGYLLYDLDTDLFAGAEGEWEERVKNVLLEGDGEDVYFMTGEDWGPSPYFNNATALDLLNKRDEIILVPCKSHESRVTGNLYICQEFDWKWAVVIKSKSGKLLINQSILQP